MKKIIIVLFFVSIFIVSGLTNAKFTEKNLEDQVDDVKEIRFDFYVYGNYCAANVDCEITPPPGGISKIREKIKVIIVVDYDLSDLTDTMFGYKIESNYRISAIISRGGTNSVFNYEEEDSVIGYYDDTGHKYGKHETEEYEFYTDKLSFDKYLITAQCRVTSNSYSLDSDGGWEEVQTDTDHEIDTDDFWASKSQFFQINFLEISNLLHRVIELILRNSNILFF